MRKIMTAVLAVVLMTAILSGCNQTAEKKQDTSVQVYSISGENEYFSLSNGVIVLNTEKEVLYGGVLEEKDPALSEIKDFTTTFYVMDGEEKHTLLSNSVVDQTGGTIRATGDTGRISGNGILRRAEAQDWMNHLYFELKTTDLSGQENVYTLQLVPIEVT